MGLCVLFPFREAKEDHRRMRAGEPDWFTDLSISVYKTESFIVKGVQTYNPNSSYCNFRYSLFVLGRENKMYSPLFLYILVFRKAMRKQR